MRVALSLVLTAAMAASTLAAEPPRFTRKPTAVTVGGKVRIEFAVDRETDVAVFIQDAKANVVRHLVAGVVGPNAPAPLAKNSLSQSIPWDGRADYGKPAGDGPFRVRVAIGLGAKLDKVLMEDPLNFGGGKGGVKGLAVGPDGTLYVLNSFGAAVPNWSGERIVALDRDGRYLRTVMPFPSSLEKAEVAGYGVVELDGRPAPLVHSIAGRSFCGAETNRKAGMAVTPDGVILRPVGGYRGRGLIALSAIDVKGGAPWGAEKGPPLSKMSRGKFGRSFVAVSADGKWAYLSGLGQVRMDKQKRAVGVSFSAVYRVKLPERTPAAVFFGKPEETGADGTHLGGTPRGLAIDGRGNLLIADPANRRVVVVSENDASFVGSFAVEGADHVAADPKTGATYVTRILAKSDVELVKLKGWQDATAIATLTVRREGDPTQPWMMALDATAKPPVLWLGGDRGSLLRIEDRGAAFAKPVRISRPKYGNSAFVDVHVDRFRRDREVYARCGQGTWYRFNEAKGTITKVRCNVPSGAGSCIGVGPRGNLYMVGWPYHLFRFDRDGKPLPWEFEGYPGEALGKTGKMQKVKPGPKHGQYSPTSMTFMTHTLGVRHDGHIFVFEPGHAGGRPPKMLVEFTPDGRRVDRDPIIWKISDTAIGPKFDAAGNIYVAEQVKPVGEPYPAEFVAKFGSVKLGKNKGRSAELKGIQHQVATMYGSIVKFTPKGGMFHFGGENPFGKAQPKLADGLKTVLATSFHGNRLYPLRVTGAEWIRMGISHVDLFYCNCENTRFDVDEFGRVFYPDLGRFRVGVLDTNGNAITHFGGYGNPESRGPESRVIDPKTGELRPRRPDDPKDLVSPFATPDVAFAWLIGVGVTDRYAYMGDSMNRRVLRAKLVSAAEATCEIK